MNSNNDPIPLTSVDGAFVHILNKLNYIHQLFTGTKTFKDFDVNDTSTTVQIYFSEIQLRLQILIDLINESKSKQKKPKQPKSFGDLTKPLMILTKIHSTAVTSLIELYDKRIATGFRDGSLCISYIDYFNKKCTCELQRTKAHNETITSLCELRTNELLSSSIDSTVKIWSIDLNNIKLVSTLQGHSKPVRKIILIREQNAFATCSDDGCIKLWTNNLPYQDIRTYREESDISSLLKPYARNIIIASCVKSNSLGFWNLSKHKRTDNMVNICTNFPNGLIELKDGIIVVGNNQMAGVVKVIDIDKKIIVKEFSEFMVGKSLSEINILKPNVFGFIYDGFTYQISDIGYEVKSAVKSEGGVQGEGGFLSSKNSQYVLIQNNACGVTVFEYSRLK